MEAVMKCHTGAAHLFIENIYMLLTHATYVFVDIK